METPGFSQPGEGLSQGDIPLRPHTEGPSIVVPTAHPPALPGTSSHNPQKPRLATRPAYAEKKQLLSSGSSKVAIPRQRSTAAPRYTRRVPLACESCRQRKTKCSGDTPVCRQCKELRISCRYPVSWRERTKGELDKLAVRVTDYENLLRDLGPLVDGRAAERIRTVLEKHSDSGSGENTQSSSVTPQDEDNDDEVTSPSSIGSLDAIDRVEEDVNRTPSSRATGYMGKNSEVTWMQRVRMEAEHRARKLPGPYEAEDEGEFAIHSVNYHLDDMDISVPGPVHVYWMPPRKVADKLFEDYLDTVHPFYPIISRTLFRAQYKTFFESAARPGDKWLAILNLIFAISAKHAHLTRAPWRGDENDHLVYLTRARILSMNGDVLFSHPDLQQVQVEGLIAYYLLASDQINRAWRIAALAVRSAVTLGLNMKNTSEGTANISKEARYRVWWCLYTFEHMLGIMTGRATTITDGICTTPFPLPFEEDQLVEAVATKLLNEPELRQEHIDSALACISVRQMPSNPKGGRNAQTTDKPRDPAWLRSLPPSSALGFLYYVDLAVISQEIVNRVYSLDCISIPWGHIENRIGELRARTDVWYANLHESYDFTRREEDQPAATLRGKLFLAFHYYSARITLGRPCLCRRDARQTASNKKETFSHEMAVITLESARRMLDLIPDVPDAVRLYDVCPWWCILHYLMQTTTVLLLELSFGSIHMPDEEANFLQAAKKAIRWLFAMSENSLASRRAWELCYGSLRQIAAGMSYDISDLPAYGFETQPQAQAQGQALNGTQHDYLSHLEETMHAGPTFYNPAAADMSNSASASSSMAQQPSMLFAQTEQPLQGLAMPAPNPFPTNPELNSGSGDSYFPYDPISGVFIRSFFPSSTDEEPWGGATLTQQDEFPRRSFSFRRRRNTSKAFGSLQQLPPPVAGYRQAHALSAQIEECRPVSTIRHAPQNVRPTVTSRFGFPPPAGLLRYLRRVMKRCLSPARLPCLDRGSSFVLHPSILRRLAPRHVALTSRGPLPDRRRQWSRQFSVGAGPPINRQLLQDYVRVEMKRCPVAGPDQSNPEAWIARLDQYLPPSLRRDSDGHTNNDDVPDDAAIRTDAAYFAQTIELANLLLHARDSGKIDLLAYVGFRLNNWPAVQFLINRLLDAADSLKEVTLPSRPLSSYDWGLGQGLSLDELTDRSEPQAPKIPQASNGLTASDMTSLDAFTERPYADDHSKRFMAEVWQSLGSIVLDAADASPNEVKLAMSHVFQVLARLHHSDAISDRVYKYVPPDSYQATFRPPGMHLLSSHIMSVLSDAAWLVHEAEVAAKAAAAGEDSPYLPFKMGVRELGPEVWLEFILWCCVEHGHIEEGVWLIDRMTSKTGDQAWKFQSWKPLLDDSGSVWQTKVDQEETWRQPGHQERSTMLRKRHSPTPFHGLGKRTMSTEVAAALLDSLPNQVYLGLGFRGMSPSALLRYASSLKFAIAPSTDDGKLLPTRRTSNWFAVRVMESGGLKPEADPRTFEDFLRITPCVVPPWDTDLYHVNEDALTRMSRSQLYDDTAALVGLIEYNIRFYSSERFCGDALNAFSWLQAIVDSSKMQRIDEFFSSRVDRPGVVLPTLELDDLDSTEPFESSMPQLSSVTLAELIDLVTVSRAFTFGNWLFYSDDIDGPPVSPRAYGDQALAPSIIRYATATRNAALCDAVVQSLSQPLSSNTLRALLNSRIALHQWDAVTKLFEYLRDYRAKSWGQSNATALAAEIIRLEHTIYRQQPPPDPSTLQETTTSLTRAKELLSRLLKGTYNEPNHIATSRFQERAISGLHNIFLSIPGTLHDLAASITNSSNNNKFSTPRNAIPYIPATAFHTLLSAIVDTRGSAAGQRFYDKWCLDTKSPTSRRLQEGGIVRFYLGKERNLAKGDPHFDARYFKRAREKATMPNPTTVRIIAQAAVAEFHEHEAEGKGAVNPAEDVLSFCIKRFEAFGMRRREINREVGGILYRRRREGDKLRREMKKEKVRG
ncbi:uncharacterized transcriptional regulatory protein C3C7.04 [Aspergillus awamori]|uniref:Uncharacterized transcriptional regulatory protein C3C7.04 n=1 Tax=Aspergillus awamori TaxID=105351 RepID=A0A401L0I5_ASPAW|nr:uncharacterized transcriptional regulatory protein C3C7.04 [Aspergillus awamori]GKZ56440.1 hypothetical protein AnigIFM49718_001687 [Aspergillus niger]